MSRSQDVARPDASGDTENSDSGKEPPLTAQAWFERGLTLNDDSAKEALFYRKALELDPDFAPAHYRLGAIYMRRAEFEKAEKHFAQFWSMATRAEKEVYNIHLYTDEKTLKDRLEEQSGGDTEKDRSGISIPFHPVGNQIVVQVVLDRNIRSNLLLDTGASITVIGQHLARRGGFPVKGRIRLNNISRHSVACSKIRSKPNSSAIRMAASMSMLRWAWTRAGNSSSWTR